jgi:hypothetical protein
MQPFPNGNGSDAGNGSQRPSPQPPANSSAAKPVGAPQKPPHNGCTDVKPRLTKEQHDILEAHFQQQHKPSTSTKKGFAESLGVPLDKINVRRLVPRGRADANMCRTGSRTGEPR